MKPLYKDSVFKKTAAFAGRLSEQPDNWPQELTSDLLKDLPFLSDYDVNVNMDKVDAERGYAFGYADIHNRTERPEQEHDEAGLPHIRIPLVVEERQRRPFSVFVDGERVMPLNEERVREHLFNPSTFDLSTTPPQDPSLVEPLMPPHRSGIGMGGDYKLASADPEMQLLQKLGYEIKPSDRPSIPKKEFAQPGKMEAGHKGKYPIPDRQHAKSALGFAKMHGDKGAEAAVRAKIHAKYPDMLKEKVSFKHISQEQWKAIYGSLDVQKMVQEYGSASHPAVQNRVYEIAAKLYGYHPKPEPPAPGKIQEYQSKMQEKKQKEMQKQQEKAKKMLQEGSKMMQPKTASSKSHVFAAIGGGAIGAAGGVLAGYRAGKYTGMHRFGEQPKTASLLLAIAPTVRDSDREAFFAKLSSDASIRVGLKSSGIFPVLSEFAKIKTASADERLSALAENILPTVVTIQKLPGGDFFVKSANVDAFAPSQATQGQQVPQEQMAGMIGQDQAQQMQPGQTTTAVAEPVEEQPAAGEKAPEPSAAGIAEFGQYNVQDLMGNQIMGWVFPTTMAWDGSFQDQPVALFTNGSAYALQDSIAGELVGKSVTLPDGQPRGEGVFYEVTREGARAMAPITVKSGMTGPDGGEMYVCTDFMGNEFTVHMSPELMQPQQISDTEYAIPGNWHFMPIMNQTQLVPNPIEMNKTSAVRREASSVTLFWNGAFNLEGGCGLNKIASSFRHDLDAVSAEFMLGLLGVNGADIKEKLAHARKKGSIKLAGLKTITTLGERYNETVKTAASLAFRIPNLRRDLVKEAAALEDEGTVDKVLALNFINPENLATFVDYVPELEQTSEKLAEMLLSGYLGMHEIPEGAVERAMKNMEEVILGLKAIESPGA